MKKSSSIPYHALVADYVAKSGPKLKIHGPEPFITVPLPVVLARLRTGLQIDGNLCGINGRTA